MFLLGACLFETEKPTLLGVWQAVYREGSTDGFYIRLSLERDPEAGNIGGMHSYLYGGVEEDFMGPWALVGDTLVLTAEQCYRTTPEKPFLKTDCAESHPDPVRLKWDGRDIRSFDPESPMIFQKYGWTADQETEDARSVLFQAEVDTPRR
jgi:hypothetical protein